MVVPTEEVSPERVRADLCSVYAEDPEANLSDTVRRLLADPVCPQDQAGRFRPHTVFLALSVAIGLSFLIFLYFTFLA